MLESGAEQSGPVVDETPQSAPQVFAYFDGSGFTDEEVALCLSYLSEVYRDLDGDGLKVVIPRTS